VAAQVKSYGAFDEAKAGHPEAYFNQRGTTLDCQGDLHIDPSAGIGFNVRIYTASHDLSSGKIEPAMLLRTVHIKKGAWIGSEVVLFHCVIGENSVVSIGSVVANRIVPPDVVVEGNPARIVARRDSSGRFVTAYSEPLERM
jgi:acetyltransferase-like isoleucine patch superfamily enzyme